MKTFKILVAGVIEAAIQPKTSLIKLFQTSDVTGQDIVTTDEYLVKASQKVQPCIRAVSLPPLLQFHKRTCPGYHDQSCSSWLFYYEIYILPSGTFASRLKPP